MPKAEIRIICWQGKTYVERRLGLSAVEVQNVECSSTVNSPGSSGGQLKICDLTRDDSILCSEIHCPEQLGTFYERKWR